MPVSQVEPSQALVFVHFSWMKLSPCQCPHSTRFSPLTLFTLLIQIGQLLASITGEKHTTQTATSSRFPNGLPAKRKSDEDSRGSALKASKPTPPPNGAGIARLGGDASKSRPSSGYAGSARPSSTAASASSNPSRPVAERSLSSAFKKPAVLGKNGSKPSPTAASFSNAARSTPPASSLQKRPAPAPAAQAQPSDSTGKAPKKGSIAEIKARAAAQQTKLQAIGKIQHKAAEKPLTKKEREEAAVEELRVAKKGLKPGTKLGGSALPSKIGNGHLDRGRGAIQKPGKAAVSSIDDKKPKKAALATTGYTGSARPPPSKAKAGPSRAGAPGVGRDRDVGREKRPNPMGMFSKPRRSRDEDYDEDMEDFVVDDEEEEDDGYGYGNRYRYADEDDDSDMEAGYSDVEDEETQAAKLARLEDEREQAILEQRKREKEARKKTVLQGRR